MPEPLDRIGQTALALPVGGLAGQVREQVDEVSSRDRQEPAAGGDTHDRLGDAEGDDLGVADLASSVASRTWQEIVGCTLDDRAESVEVGVHRGLRTDGVLGTVGFGLSTLLSLDSLDLVESIN